MSAEMEYWVKEHDLVFDRYQAGETVVVLAGDDSIAKTQLVRRVFEDHPSFFSRDLEDFLEYQITLQSLLFYIRIQDLKNVDAVTNTMFFHNSVFFFCFDLDDESSLERLERTWIAAFKARELANMYSLLVGIRRDPEGAAVAAVQPPEWASIKPLSSFCERHHIGWHAICSTSDKSSLLNAFQIAIDTTYPKVMVN